MDARFPKIIDRYFEGAMEDEYRRPAFSHLYDTCCKEASENLKNICGGNMDDDAETALNVIQLDFQQIGFLVGFRYAMRLAQEVYER